MGLQTELQEKINAQMKEWNEGLQELKEKIRVLRVKADKVEDHIKATYRTTLTCFDNAGPVTEQPNRGCTPPGVGTPLRARGRPLGATRIVMLQGEPKAHEEYLEKKVEVLQSRMEAGKQECHKFIQASGEAWKEVTSGLEAAWDNVKKGVGSAWADLKSALDQASTKFT